MGELDDRLRLAVEAAFESEQVPALKLLVEQPSHTPAREDVAEAASLLDELAAAVGLEVARYPDSTARFADHRVYSTPGIGERKATALVGHIDTVHPRASGFLSFARDGNIARGPGVVDMKSGLTCVLFALRAYREVVGSYDALPIKFVCVTDEEVGSPSSRDVYAQIAGTLSGALVFEKGRAQDRIVTCRKGGGTFTVTAKGRAAHAGNAHAEGVSAVHALSLLVPKFEAVTDYGRGITVNVGIFEGGTAKNTVPEHASIVIDTRVVESDTIADVRQAFEEIVATPMPPRLADVRFELSGTITRPPMEKTPDIEALRLAYEPHAAAVGLGTGEAPRQGGFSDANLLAGHGVPTIDGIGPWGDGAHSTDEWCDLDSLRKRTMALATFLAAIAG